MASASCCAKCVTGGRLANRSGWKRGQPPALIVGKCPEAALYWILNLGIHGPEYGLNAFRTEQLPSPAARFACNPLLSGTDGGHYIHLRDLGRQGMRLHGHLEAVDDGGLVFSDDLPERLTAVEAGFGRRMQPLFDAYIEAAGNSVPPAEPAQVDDWLPSSSPRVELTAENITTVLWATGYKLDMGVVDIPVLDEWDYPRHSRGHGVPGSVRRGTAVADRALFSAAGRGWRGCGVFGGADCGA